MKLAEEERKGTRRKKDFKKIKRMRKASGEKRG